MKYLSNQNLISRQTNTSAVITANQMIVANKSCNASAFFPPRYHSAGRKPTRLPVMAAEITNRLKNATGARKRSGMGPKIRSAFLITKTTIKI